MTRRAFFIVNPAAGAGRGAGIWEHCALWLRQQGAHPEFTVTRAPGEARHLAREAATRCELVVAVGGDGTVSEVADGLLGAASARANLAVIPCGTGNDFAETLGIMSIDAAQEALIHGTAREVDVIEVQCRLADKPVRRHVLLFAAVGIAAECLKQTTPRVKRFFGQRRAYTVGLIRALWSYRAPHMSVTVDGETFEKEFLFAGISNSERAGGGFKLAPGAQIHDGRLNVNLVEALGRWEAFGQIRRLGHGTHVGHPRVRYSTAVRMTVHSSAPLEIAADGELIGETPATCEIRPGALQVLVPKGNSDARSLTKLLI